MEPRPTTPPDAARPTPGEERSSREGDLYDGAGEDWSARYGMPPPPPPRGGFDPTSLFVLLDAFRRAAPAELQDRVTGLIREVLLTLRSLIDWYLDRLDRQPAEPRVEDIPID